MDLAGRTALVTGAGSGIGGAFAEQLAVRGADLIVVARRRNRLEQLDERITRQHGHRVTVLATDLTVPGTVVTLADDVARLGLTVDVLVNNTGFGTHGPLIGESGARISDEVQLNVGALVDLTRCFLPGTVERGDGTVVNVASTASFQPIPFMAVYGATKAFVLSFTEAVWAETRETGVRVLALAARLVGGGARGVRRIRHRPARSARWGSARLGRGREQRPTTSTARWRISTVWAVRAGRPGSRSLLPR
jgi:short-subunit dehydrogenase